MTVAIRAPAFRTARPLPSAARFPFDDTQDFDEAFQRLIAAPDSLQIEAEAGGFAWDLERFDFLKQGENFDSIHPSLERQARLTTQFGLYEVMDGIYQVRGYDLSNLTLIESETGWMVYQYAFLLPASPFGYVTQGLGQSASSGATGLVAPTMEITDPIEEHIIDGVKMVFQLTPGTEAPSELNTYLPDMKALCMAENVTGTMHNIYTLRGAQVRDALGWSQFINEALQMFGQDAEVMFASHHWPRFGNARIQEVLRAQRDLYANLNNQVLHFANQGVTINEIHNVYEPPASIANNWFNRGYHGSVQHNVRAVINRYLGYWDANPAMLIPLSPADAAPLYVEMMGGANAIMAKGQELFDGGAYFQAVEILNKLVYAEPANTIGYQQENPGLRNSFLAGAYELRSPLPQGTATETATPDVIQAMATGLFLDYVGVKMDSRKVGDLAFTVNIVHPDIDEQYILELSNATLTNIEGYQADDADLTVTIDREQLVPVMIGEATIDAQIDAGNARAEGDRTVLTQMASLLTDFEMTFEVMPGTDGATAVPGRYDTVDAATGEGPFEVKTSSGSSVLPN
ncbi:alkyl/aryl-sulfatase [Fluviibacterium sp. S390]|uniref:alkyl/aryl-sulfatase n=1 Tax=Fluviibacterium sp. S390 TaxID=3415139 RepID=UPI003C7A839F